MLQPKIHLQILNSCFLGYLKNSFQLMSYLFIEQRQKLSIVHCDKSARCYEDFIPFFFVVMNCL